VVATGRQQRSATARVLAPVAFLLAVTIAVLLVRAGLREDDPPVPREVGVTAVEPAYYVVRRGDTLGSIAGRYGTTVSAIRQLNPGVDPVSLDVGRRLRVR
jgi:LysM repeat protein